MSRLSARARRLVDAHRQDTEVGYTVSYVPAGASGLTSSAWRKRYFYTKASAVRAKRQLEKSGATHVQVSLSLRGHTRE